MGFTVLTGSKYSTSVTQIPWHLLNLPWQMQESEFSKTYFILFMQNSHLFPKVKNWQIQRKDHQKKGCFIKLYNVIKRLAKETTFIKYSTVLFKIIYVSSSHTVTYKTWTKCSMITFQTITWKKLACNATRICAQYLSYAKKKNYLGTNKYRYHKTEPSVPLRCLYICLKWTRAFDNH